MTFTPFTRASANCLSWCSTAPTNHDRRKMRARTQSPERGRTQSPGLSLQDHVNDLHGNKRRIGRVINSIFVNQHQTRKKTTGVKVVRNKQQQQSQDSKRKKISGSWRCRLMLICFFFSASSKSLFCHCHCHCYCQSLSIALLLLHLLHLLHYCEKKNPLSILPRLPLIKRV